MSVNDYIGIEGFAVNAENAQDVYEAIDRIHTQVLDNIGDDSVIIPILERAMNELLGLDEVSP